MQRVQGRALLVGDAAGLADPFLGEGVGQAVFSGRLAARAILAGDTRAYLTGLRDTLLADARSARFIARVVYGVPGWWQHMARRHPGSVELEWQLLRGELRHQDLLKQIKRKVLAKALYLDLLPWGRYSK